MEARRASRRLRLLVPAAVLALSALAHSQDEAGDPARIIQALSIEPGAVIAEIGAGDGSLTVALARHVGAGGRVFTTELGDERLRALRDAVDRATLPQVSVVSAALASTNLDAACCDALVMRDVYHHFSDPARMNVSLFSTLRPGGGLAILDFEPRRGESGTPGARADGDRHGVARQAVADELTAAGFVEVRAQSIAGRRFMVTARKPPTSTGM